ncbi:MAG TPA: glycosyltransferase family 39 protein [Patescibacteria group bacterium]
MINLLDKLLKKKVLPFFVLIIFLFSTFKLYQSPFNYFEIYEGFRLRVLAESFTLFGFRNNFNPFYFNGVNISNNPVFETHHPPLPPILLAIVFEIFGTDEIVSRMFAIIVSIGIIFGIYLIGRELFNRKVGVISSIITLLIPTYQINFAIVSELSTALLFGIFSFYFYLKYLKFKNFKYLFLSISVAILSLFSEWFGLGVFLLIAVHQFWTGRLKTIKIWLTFLIIGLILTILLFFQKSLVSSESATSFILSKNIKIYISHPINYWVEIFLELVLKIIKYLSPLIILTPLLVYRKLKLEKVQLHFLLMLLIFGLPYYFLIADGVLVESSRFSLFLVPFLAIFSSFLIYKFRKRFIIGLLVFVGLIIWNIFFYLKFPISDLNYVKSFSILSNTINQNPKHLVVLGRSEFFFVILDKFNQNIEVTRDLFELRQRLGSVDRYDGFIIYLPDYYKDDLFGDEEKIFEELCNNYFCNEVSEDKTVWKRKF